MVQRLSPLPAAAEPGRLEPAFLAAAEHGLDRAADSGRAAAPLVQRWASDRAAEEGRGAEARCDPTAGEGTQAALEGLVGELTDQKEVETAEEGLCPGAEEGRSPAAQEGPGAEGGRPCGSAVEVGRSLAPSGLGRGSSPFILR